jgi:hypothetical protein
LIGGTTVTVPAVVKFPVLHSDRLRGVSAIGATLIVIEPSVAVIVPDTIDVVAAETSIGTARTANRANPIPKINNFFFIIFSFLFVIFVLILFDFH